jgi:hypothetical protein
MEKSATRAIAPRAVFGRPAKARMARYSKSISSDWQA